MRNSLQVTVFILELNGLERVIGALYQSACNSLVENDFDKFIGLSKSKKYIFAVNSFANTWINTLC